MELKMKFLNVLSEQLENWKYVYPELDFYTKYIERMVEASHFKRFCFNVENNRTNIAYFFFKNYYLDKIFEFLYQTDYDGLLKSLPRLIAFDKSDSSFKKTMLKEFHSNFPKTAAEYLMDNKVNRVRFYDDETETSNYTFSNTIKVFFEVSTLNTYLIKKLDCIIEHFDKIEVSQKTIESYENLFSYENSNTEKAFKIEENWINKNFLKTMVEKDDIEEFNSKTKGKFKYVYDEIDKIVTERVRTYANFKKNEIPYETAFMLEAVFHNVKEETLIEQFLNNVDMKNKRVNLSMIDLLSPRKMVRPGKLHSLKNIIKMFLGAHPYFKNFGQQAYSDNYESTKEDLLNSFKKDWKVEAFNSEYKMNYVKRNITQDFLDVFPERYVRQANTFIKPFVDEKRPNLNITSYNQTQAKRIEKEYNLNNNKVIDIIRQAVCFTNFLRNLKMAYYDFEVVLKDSPESYDVKNIEKEFRRLIDDVINFCYCHHNRLKRDDDGIIFYTNITFDSNFQKRVDLHQYNVEKRKVFPYLKMSKFFQPNQIEFEGGIKNAFKQSEKFFNTYMAIFDCASFCLYRLLSNSNIFAQNFRFSQNRMLDRMKNFEKMEIKFGNMLDNFFNVFKRKILDEGEHHYYTSENNNKFIDFWNSNKVLKIPSSFDEYCEKCKSPSYPFYLDDRYKNKFSPSKGKSLSVFHSGPNIGKIVENFFVFNSKTKKYEKRFDIQTTENGLFFVEKETGKRFEFYKQSKLPTLEEFFWCANIVDEQERNQVFSDMMSGGLYSKPPSKDKKNFFEIIKVNFLFEDGLSLFLIEVIDDNPKIKPIDWIGKNLSQYDLNDIKDVDVFCAFQGFLDVTPQDEAHKGLFNNMIRNITLALKNSNFLERIRGTLKSVRTFIETIRCSIDGSILRKIIYCFNCMCVKFSKWNILSFSKWRILYKGCVT